jgi:hypothetical protein
VVDDLPRPFKALEYPVPFIRHSWTLATLSAKIKPMIWFDHPPVCVIDRAKPGIIRQVTSVDAAIEELKKWSMDGRKFTKALKICGEARAGRIAPETAKNAFEVAAKEAKVWVAYRGP